MEQFSSTLALFIALFTGLLAGKLPRQPSAQLREGILNLALYSLLFTMGWTTGKTLTSRMEATTAGGMSLLAAVFALAGTLLVLFLGYKLFPSARMLSQEERKSHSLRHLIHHLKEPLVPLAFVALGILWSRIFLILPGQPAFPQAGVDRFISVVLYVLLFLIGLQLAIDKVPLGSMLKNPAVILIPLGTMIGTLLGGVALAPFLDISPGKAAAVVSGFGWYSLSGVLITELGDPLLGTVAFLSNLFRESLAMILIPFLGRTSYPGLAVGAGGATSMDVTLPLIEKACGSRIVPYSVISGTLLSLAVPLLVPLLFSLK